MHESLIAYMYVATVWSIIYKFMLSYLVYVSVGRYTLLALGTYQYNCSGIGYGNVTAVPAKHSIALCKQCIKGSQEHSINVGDLVEWSVVSNSEMRGQSPNCTMLINQVFGGNKSM